MKSPDPFNHYYSLINESLNEFHGIKPVNAGRLDTFTKAFIEAFLIDINEFEERSKEEREDGLNLHLIDRELKDIDPRSLKKIIKDCKKFQDDNIEEIEKGGAGLDDPYERAGYDFYFTRNGAGVGFWETDKWEDPYGKQLTTAAKKFGSIDGYVGDDDKVYVMGAEKDWTAGGVIQGVSVPKEEKPYKDSYEDGDDDDGGDADDGERLREGGSKIKEPNAGITNDMSGRWTIKAFDTSRHGKKETPPMKEVTGPNETATHEIGIFYTKAKDPQIEEYEAHMRNFEKYRDKKFQDLALNVVERFLGIKFKGPLATGLPIN
jgi:hypothetical protein